MKPPAFTSEKAKLIGNKLSIDWEGVDLEQFRIGLETELEHGKQNPLTNVTDDDELKTAKIALAHLAEIPDYYTRLRKMEQKAGHKWDRRKKVKKIKTSCITNNSLIVEDIKKLRFKLEESQDEIPFLNEQLEMLKHGDMKKSILKQVEKYMVKLDKTNKKMMAIKDKCLDLEGRMEKEILTGKVTLKRSLLHKKQKLEKLITACLHNLVNFKGDLKKLLHAATLFKAEHATF